MTETNKTLPLSGIRVLDLGRMIAAPWATQILGDLGAEIIKVERPKIGDDIRSYGPPFLKLKDGADGDSPYHLAVNRNKKSITADLATPGGQKLIRDLAAVCDVFVENYKAGDLARYGLDYAGVSKVNPDIVYCSVTGFGQTGPYSHRPGLDSLFQAMSGLMSITGEPDGPPQKVGTPISDFTAGMYATVAILAALRHREINGGGGQYIDMALLDCQMAALTNRGQTYLSSGVVPQRNGAATPGNQPAGLYSCQDGEIILSAGADRQFRNLAQIIGRPALGDDPRFLTRQLRVKHSEELNEALNSALRTQPRAHWMEVFQSSGVMCAPINTVAEAFEDVQVKHRNTVVTTEHPTAGPISLIASPLKFSKTPVPPPSHPPLLGEHTNAVLQDLLGLSTSDIEALRAEGAI